MRAAIYHGNRDIRVETRAEPQVGPGEVGVEVAHTGICGTDIHEYRAGPILTPADEPHPVTGETLPIVLGHEVSGVVRETGDGVEDLAAGEEVVINPMLPCHDCRYCHAGKHNVCADLGFVGLSGGGGGFAEYLVVDRENVVSIPEGVPLEAGALVEPLSVGLHAVRRSPLRAGDAVAVFGSGPIGLCVVQAARAAGAGRIVVSEPRDSRREVAERVGADVTIDPARTDPVEEIADLTDGGTEVAFEVAGVDASFGQALHATQHDGHLTVVSLYEEEVSFDPNDLVTVERTIGGTNVYTGGPRSAYEYGMTLSMLERGVFEAEPLITDRIPLDDVVGGFEDLTEADSEHVKVLVEP
jgi:(R,R)-butanediol dehydrogenase/meso-butanediol dehydrogenase/diacetyl reductase